MTQLTTETVLIVDDNPVNLSVIATVLTGAGYKILVADEGPSAIELAGKARPHIILLDIMMPQMDGFEVCQRLKANPELSDIPVLFLTARSESLDKVRGFEAGAVDYITKPYQEPEVLARVSTHLTLARQKRELQTLLSERERFMHIAAHDLRNPLSAITWQASFGLESHDLEAVRKQFHGIKRSARQMNALIEDFLTLQTLGKSEEGKTSFPVQLLVQQAIEQQLFPARNKEIQLVFQPPPDKELAHGNAAYANQIITNYLSNAIKFSPPKTEVRIVTQLQANTWRIEVQDQGPGVPPHERSKLFLEFAKLSTKPTGGETSTGLGLAIVKKLAESMNGAVGASFPPEGGAVFWLELCVVES